MWALPSRRCNSGESWPVSASAAKSALLEIGPGRLAGGNSQNVEIVQLARSLRPERLEHAGSIGIAFGEEVAESEQVARLVGIRDVVHHRFERSDGGAKVVLPIVGQADVEANSGDPRRQMLGLMQHVQRLRPLLAPHVDDAQIGVGAGRLRVQRQHSAKRTLGHIEVVLLQSGFALLKQLLRARDWGLRRRSLGLRMTDNSASRTRARNLDSDFTLL